ncbi:GSDA3 protein, partial [Pitta sordida]|nr:GSDA3 protein [Pitta sordida]
TWFNSAELLEDQLLLLLQSLERKIVSQQLHLVSTHITLGSFEQISGAPFHVDARLLSFPQEEEQSWTMALVELSGVKLQEDGSAVPKNHSFEAVAALFVSMYVLNLLSG